MYFKELLRVHRLDPAIYDVISKMAPFPEISKDDKALFFLPIPLPSTTLVKKKKRPKYLH
jgi:hypothetical protein